MLLMKQSIIYEAITQAICEWENYRHLRILLKRKINNNSNNTHTFSVSMPFDMDHVETI